MIGSDSPLRRSTFAAKPELSHAASSGVGKPIKKEEDEKPDPTVRVFKLAKSAVEVVAGHGWRREGWVVGGEAIN